MSIPVQGSRVSDYLFVIGRIPIRIKQDKSIPTYQIEATTTSLAAQEKDKLILPDAN